MSYFSSNFITSKIDKQAFHCHGSALFLLLNTHSVVFLYGKYGPKEFEERKLRKLNGANTKKSKT
ncbi:hypothetical protein HZS_6817 [Henneguya salminicola]|nr:hypothetical protein HZS_6817 [Henneguya salminicola]